MKNLKRHMITTLLILVALSLAACDGVSGGVSIDELTAAFDSAETGSGDQQAFSGSHGKEDLASASSSGSPDVSASSPVDGLKLKGMIEAVTESTITLNGEALNVATVEDLTTLFQAGTSYEIEYRLNEDGTISLLDFHLEDSSSDDYLKFKGMVEAVTENTVSFGGETYIVDNLENLGTVFEVGAFYEIEYRINENDTISLIDFHLEDSSSDDYLKFKGMIEAVTENTVSFGGETYIVDNLENLAAIFEVGAFYEIEYRLNENDTISLIDFHLEDSSMDDDDDMDDNMDDSMDDDDSDDDDMDDGMDDDDSYDDSSSHNNDSNNSNDNNSSNNNNDDDDENDND